MRLLEGQSDPHGASSSETSVQSKTYPRKEQLHISVEETPESSQKKVMRTDRPASSFTPKQAITAHKSAADQGRKVYASVRRTPWRGPCCLTVVEGTTEHRSRHTQHDIHDPYSSAGSQLIKRLGKASLSSSTSIGRSDASTHKKNLSTRTKQIPR